jgi:hypothetical protein
MFNASQTPKFEQISQAVAKNIEDCNMPKTDCVALRDKLLKEVKV